MTQIVTLKDVGTGNYIYPVTSTKSVVDTGGSTLESIIGDINVRIEQLSSAYRIMGAKSDISEVTGLSDAKIGDVWYVKNAFDLGDSSYPGGTSVLCITNSTPETTGEGNWISLGSMFDLSEYVTKTEAKEFATCVPVSSALDILE